MKKFLSVLLTAAMCGTLAACSSDSSSTPSGEASQGGSEQSTETAAWPTQDITIYVPNNAGSANDLTARIFSTFLQKNYGINPTVINNADGGGITAYEEVRNAKPDGTTFLWQHSGINVSYWMGNYDYRPDEVFTQIGSLAANGAQAYCVRTDAPYNNIDEMVAYAKENPEGIRMGVKLGNASHISGVQMENILGIKFKMVDAADQATRLSALLGDNIDLGSMDCVTAQQYVDSGDLKILFTTAPYKDDIDNATDWNDGALSFLGGTIGTILWGPADMDPELVAQIDAAMEAATQDAEVQEQLAALGQIVGFSDTDVVTEFIKNDFKAKGEATAGADLNVHLDVLETLK